MIFEEIKTIIEEINENIDLIDISILNISNKTYLIYDNAPKSILVKMENLIDLESVNLIEFMTERFPDEFVQAEALRKYKNSVFVLFNIQNLEFLDFNSPILKSLSIIEKFRIYRDFLIILHKLILLKEDLSNLDPKLFYIEKISLNDDSNIKEKKFYIKLKYLYTCKFISYLYHHSIII